MTRLVWFSTCLNENLNCLQGREIGVHTISNQNERPQLYLCFPNIK